MKTLPRTILSLIIAMLSLSARSAERNEPTVHWPSFRGHQARGVATGFKTPERWHVLRANPKFEVIATNPLGDLCMATPAISEGQLFFRTRTSILAIGNKN